MLKQTRTVVTLIIDNDVPEGQTVDIINKRVGERLC